MSQVGCARASATVTSANSCQRVACGTARRWQSASPGRPPRAARPAGPEIRHCARCRPAGCWPAGSWPAEVDQRAADHQAFLVGQGHRLAGLQRRPGASAARRCRRWPRPRCPSSGRARRSRAHRPRARTFAPRRPAASTNLAAVRHLAIGHDDPLRPHALGLLYEQFRAAIGTLARSSSPSKARSPPACSADAPGRAEHSDVLNAIGHGPAMEVCDAQTPGSVSTSAGGIPILRRAAAGDNRGRATRGYRQ